MKNTKLSPLFRVIKFTSWIYILCFLFYALPMKAIDISHLDLNQPALFDLKNKTYRSLFSEIENQTGCIFFYREDIIDLEEKVTIEIKDKSIQAILEELFNNSNYQYLIDGRQIFISKKEEEPKVSVQHQSLKKTIQGIIIDSKEEPLIGATVTLLNSNKGSITDIDGLFTIPDAEIGNIIEVRYLGYQPQRFKVTQSDNYKIMLKEESHLMDEIVVVGFGSQKKVNLSGSVSTLNAKTFESRPIVSATQALQGTVPGLNINTSYGGNLDKKASINIRGAATIGEGSTGEPLILIDGTWGDINTLNPQDIENISVLKDAAASSIYGSRAPFGVVLITTKKGSKGKAKINYNNSIRWVDPIVKPKSMDSYNFALFSRELDKNEGKTPWINDEWFQRIIDFKNGEITTTTIPNKGNPSIWEGGYAGGNDNVDKYKLLYDSWVFSHEHNLSASGGSDNMNYYISGQYLDQDGLLKINKDKLERYTLTAKIGAKLTNYLTVNYSSRYSREKFKRPNIATEAWLSQHFGRQAWPLLPVYDNNGYVLWSKIVELKDRGNFNSENDVLTQQLQFIINPLKGLNIYTEINYRLSDNFHKSQNNKTYRHNVAGEPFPMNRDSGVYEYAYRSNYYNYNLYAEFFKTFKEKHNIKLMLGQQAEKNKYRDLQIYKQGLIFPSKPSINGTTGLDENGKKVEPSTYGQHQKWATAGFFGRLNYDYKEKYLVEMNLRYDGTSRYRKDNRWLTLPSFSLAWNLAKEDFWSGLQDKISMLKIRTSYGLLGNQNTSNWYPTYSIMPMESSAGKWLIDGQKPNISWAPNLVSVNLGWEKVNTWNIGADLAAFNNRLNASLDIYSRYTRNMVGPARDLPVILGTKVPKMNNTNLKTYGFELDLSWRDRLENGLGYGVHFMLWDNQTIITKYPNENKILTNYRKGQKLGEIWGFETAGIAKTDAEMQQHLSTLPNGGQNALGSRWEAGDIMYKDLNGDGKVDRGANTADDHGDLKKIGNSTPRFNFGLNLNADWKGFDISMFFQGVMKRDYYQGSYYFWGVGSNLWEMIGWKEHGDYFRSDTNHPLGANLNSYYPRPLYNYKNRQTQSKYLQNAAYIRLKNIQIGYTLPRQVIKNLGINNLRIYFSGENLLTKTKMSSLFDPETINGGWGGNAYPLSKTLSFGLSVNL